MAEGHQLMRQKGFILDAAMVFLRWICQLLKLIKNQLKLVFFHISILISTFHILISTLNDQDS